MKSYTKERRRRETKVLQVKVEQPVGHVGRPECATELARALPHPSHNWPCMGTRYPPDPVIQPHNLQGRYQEVKGVKHHEIGYELSKQAGQGQAARCAVAARVTLAPVDDGRDCKHVRNEHGFRKREREQ
jgi:hypothetical protein